MEDKMRKLQEGCHLLDSRWNKLFFITFQKGCFNLLEIRTRVPKLAIGYPTRSSPLIYNIYNNKAVRCLLLRVSPAPCSACPLPHILERSTKTVVHKNWTRLAERC